MKIPMDYVAVDIETTGLYPKYDRLALPESEMGK